MPVSTGSPPCCGSPRRARIDYTHAMDGPANVVLLATPADQEQLDRLRVHLRPLQDEGLLVVWAENEIGAGMIWEETVPERAAAADLLLALVSADLLACPRRLPLIAGAGGAGGRVVPVLARPSAWESTALGALAPLPGNGLPVNAWADPDAAWRAVVDGLRLRFSPLAVEVAVELASAPAVRYRTIQITSRRQDEQAFSLGQLIRVRFQASRDCHVVLVNVGTSGGAQQIYPAPGSPAVPCSGGRPHYFPRSTDDFAFTLGGPPGTEILYLLARPGPARLTPEDLRRLQRGESLDGWVQTRRDFVVRPASGGW